MNARIATVALSMLLTVGIAGDALARRQLLLLSDRQMAQMGAESFDKLKASDQLAHDPRKLAAAQCVVTALVAQLPDKYRQQAWEVQVFADANPNAFALPGGKVGVNTGMFDVIRSQDELAAVIGHEISHVTSNHANERVSRQLLAGVGLQAVEAFTGTRTSARNTQLMMGALGLGAQLGVIPPNTRTQEKEADQRGQQLMAKAGFDPAQAMVLWQHMLASSPGGRPPQILSTHPDPQNRIKDLAAQAPGLRPEFLAARQAGLRPACF